jgi:hypothetical protein
MFCGTITWFACLLIMHEMWIASVNVTMLFFPKSIVALEGKQMEHYALQMEGYDEDEDYTAAGQWEGEGKSRAERGAAGSQVRAGLLGNACCLSIESTTWFT